jgi:ribosomal protein S18 acetylase RimI-like enzyme
MVARLIRVFGDALSKGVTTMAFTLKRLSTGDSPVLANIGRDVFDEPIDRRRLSEYVGTPGHMMVVAIEEGIVIGQCAGVIHRHPDKATELYVDEVGTASTHRRQGIARAMLDELFRWGRERGCEEAWLGTELDNEPANALYRSYTPTEDEAMQFYVFKL